MDKIADFFKEIKSRLSSPLIFSFILSWMIINWRVTISLIFYKISELSKDSYNSYLDLIAKNSSTWAYLIFPLIIAVLYTFGFPFIRSGIQLFQTWLNIDTDKKIQKMSNSVTIPMERYLKDRRKYIELSEQLKDIMDKESEYVTQNLELQTEKNNLQKSLAEYSDLSSIHFLDGYWDIQHKLNGGEKTERIHIFNGTLYHSVTQGKDEELLRISNCGINPGTKDLILLFEQANKNPSFTCVFRYMNQDKLILKNHEQGALILQMDKYVKRNEN